MSLSREERAQLLKDAGGSRSQRSVVNCALLTNYVTDKDSLSDEEIALVERELECDEKLKAEYESLLKGKPWLIGAETSFSCLSRSAFLFC